ncbi:hypothetical protein PAECIP111893_02903 [Paenibacillus plantiphilus]|uniref:Leucine-rich repeat domain-containing protein n=1 Tax=Paenibacillus plantiphilus TaxID=2905650 RepID=A0ABM9CC36_9BACL|nr:leucine-rich repeat domain-containing protein [Paenibacillus plantiphilus]CAH1208801.1 hypothetical protein PAECIP111893_02903 [Paenibacillus plantiphilus]
MKKRWFVVIIVCCVLLILSIGNVDKQLDREVMFEDAAFEQMIRQAIITFVNQDFEGAVKRKDMKKLGGHPSITDTAFIFDNLLIDGRFRSIEGIEYLHGMKLAIIASDINLEPLGRLDSLQGVLFFEVGEISDISPLRNIQSLSIIGGRSEFVFNDEQLLQFHNLKSVDIFSKIRPKESLLVNLQNNRNLESLTIQGIDMSGWDLGALRAFNKLMKLTLDNNEITTIAWLKDLDQVTSLSLSDNRIQDISILLELPQLEIVSIADNPLNDTAEHVVEQLNGRGVRVIME